MKILSFNCRGLASPEKKLALKHLLLSDLVDVILLQETLCKAEAVIPILSSWLPGWTFHTLDISGRSGGITVGFKHSTFNLKNWGGGEFMGADIYSKDLEEELRIINVYGPCHNRELFWRRLLSSPLLLEDNMILGGDLNFSLGFLESWGHMAQIDPLFDFFEHLLEKFL